MRCIAVMLALMASISVLAADSEASRVDAATRYLCDKYRGAEKQQVGSVMIRDLAFLPERERLVPFKEPLLARLRPDTTFYTSEVATPYFEYWNAEVLVSVRSTPDGYEVRSMLSPVYADTAGEFLAQFRGLVAASPEDKAALPTAIASLLVPITYEGSVRAPSNENGRFSVELWHGDQHWRDVIVVFTPADAVRSVEVVNPKQR